MLHRYAPTTHASLLTTEAPRDQHNALEVLLAVCHERLQRVGARAGHDLLADRLHGREAGQSEPIVLLERVLLHQVRRRWAVSRRPAAHTRRARDAPERAPPASAGTFRQPHSPMRHLPVLRDASPTTVLAWSGAWMDIAAPIQADPLTVATAPTAPARLPCPHPPGWARGWRPPAWTAS